MQWLAHIDRPREATMTSEGWRLWHMTSGCGGDKRRQRPSSALPLGICSRLGSRRKEVLNLDPLTLLHTWDFCPLSASAKDNKNGHCSPLIRLVLEFGHFVHLVLLFDLVCWTICPPATLDYPSNNLKFYKCTKCLILLKF